MTSKDRELLIRINLRYLIDDTIDLLKEMRCGKAVSPALLSRKTDGIIILKELIGGRNEIQSNRRRKCSKICEGKSNGSRKNKMD